MKKLIILLISSCLCLFHYAQIPNHDFEHWSFVNGIEEPDNWVTNNIPSHISVEKSTISYSGNFAAKIISNGPSFEGPAPGWLETTVVPVEFVNQLSFFYRCDTIAAPAVGEITVEAWMSGNKVSSVFEISEKTQGFQQFNGPLSINALPDSLTIRIVAKTINNGLFFIGHVELLVDSVSLSFSTRIQENLRFLNDIKIYPNPASSILNIEVPENKPDKSLRYKLFTLDGRSVGNGTLQTGRNTIDVRKVNSRALIVKTTDGEVFVNTRIIIH